MDQKYLAREKTRKRFELVISTIEGPPPKTQSETARILRYSYSTVNSLLKRGGYIYCALLNERQVIKDEVDKIKKSSKRLVPCGTVTAYRRHLRHKEAPCKECRDANAAETRKKQTQLRDINNPNRKCDSLETRQRKSKSAQLRWQREFENVKTT